MMADGPPWVSVLFRGGSKRPRRIPGRWPFPQFLFHFGLGLQFFPMASRLGIGAVSARPPAPPPALFGTLQFLMGREAAGRGSQPHFYDGQPARPMTGVMGLGAAVAGSCALPVK